MEMVKCHFNKQYKSSLDVSRDVAEDIKAFWLDVGLKEDVIDQIELCLVELVNNAYEHAYQLNEGEPIELNSYIKNNELVIEIADYGESMTDEEFEKAVKGTFIEPDPEDPETWTTSGRGFIIVVQLTDNLEYEKAGGKNTFKLYKKTEA
ncbi:ATP-binding protein [Photobacterium swingsii]|uniref:ATP-binding protein n=1 Tax=Photobacterium swingsii TaxID=680026 RepID=UPI003D0FC1D6